MRYQTAYGIVLFFLIYFFVGTTELRAKWTDNGLTVCNTTGVLLAAPVITSFTPMSGPIGSSVTLSGTGFDAVAANNEVYFGTIQATITAASTTSLTVTVPTGATYQPITVLNKTSGEQAQSPVGFMVTNTIRKDIASRDLIAPQRFALAASIYKIISADIDGDGKNDIALVGVDASFSVFRNAATAGQINAGSFDARIDIPIPGAYAKSIAVADLDGDGKSDIAILDFINNKIYLFRNTSTPGSVSFGARVDLSCSGGYSLALADIDGDGRTDIVAGNLLSPSVSIFRNISTVGSITTASFDAEVSLPVPSSVNDLVAGDIDGDGKPELLIAEFVNPLRVHIIPNNAVVGVIGSATFGTPVTLTAGAGLGAEAIRLGDIDGDGKPDVLCATYGDPGAVNIFRNKSVQGTIDASSFEAVVTFPGAMYGRDIQMGDITGDGKPEVVLSSEAGASIQVYQNLSVSGSINAGSLSSTTFSTVNGVSNPLSIALADIDGDGLLDITAGMNFGQVQLGVMRYNPLLAPSTNATNIVFTGTSSSQTNISWTNGNGHKRMVFVTNNTSATLPAPVDGTVYSANASFGQGSALNPGGWYVVYMGSGSSVTVSNLSPGRSYRVAVIEYSDNGYSDAARFNTNAATGNPANLVMPATLALIARSNGTTTNAPIAGFDLLFDAAVTGVTANNFVLSTTGSVSGASISAFTVTGTPSIYHMTVNTGTGSGTLALQLDNVAGVTPILSNTLPFTGPAYIIDKDAPTLTTTSIGSNNAISAAFATTGDIITLQVAKPSDAVSATALINGFVVTPTLSGGIYAASLAVTGAMRDGLAAFSMTVRDAVGNASTTTSVTTGQPLTIDKTAPVLTAATIFSNNTNTSTAKPGNRVTVQFTANEPLSSASVTIFGSAATVTQVSATVWSASFTPSLSASEGTVPFSIAYTDRAGNSGINVTTTSDNKAVVFRKSPPATTGTTIKSNYRDITIAAAGDVVKVSFAMNTPIATPTVVIAGHTVTPVQVSTLAWEASITMTGTEPEGQIAFSIKNIIDIAGNTGPDITSSTDFSSVNFTGAAPDIFFVSMDLLNPAAIAAKPGDAVKLSFTPNEVVRNLSATIATHPVIVNTSSTVWTATYTMTASDAEGVVPFTISFADFASNTVKTVTATTNHSSVTFDKTPPVLGMLTISSDYTNTHRVKPGNTAIVKLTANETIFAPTVIIAGHPVVASAVGSNSWQAGYTMTAADAEGTVPFSVAIIDLAGNTASFTATTDNADLIFDKTPPSINNIVIASGNRTGSRAKPGDVVTLTFNTSETVQTPNVTFGGNASAVTTTGTNRWKAVYTITTRDADGTMPFAITALDLAGNSAVVNTTSDSSQVIVDKTLPTIGTLAFTSSNAIMGKAKAGNQVTLKFTAGETIASVTAIIATHTITAVNVSGNTWQAAYVMAIADEEGVIPFILKITDLAGNESLTTTNASTGKIIFDKTAPIVNSIKRQLPLTANVAAEPVTYRVSFSEPVMNVLKTKFTLNETGTAGAALDTVLMVNDSTYDVKLRNLTGNGNLRLDLTGFATVTDSSGNAMTAAFSAGELYTVTTTTNTAPVFNAGATANISICESVPVVDLSSLLTVTDADSGQPLRWSVTGDPAHGTIGNIPATATSNGATVAPQNAGYAPAKGYAGTDQFTIKVSDGTDTASITVHITITPLPVINIAAAQGTTLCGTGATLPLTISSGNGFAWTRNGLPVGGNTNTFIVRETGIYTVVVTDANGCAAQASNNITVNAVPQPKAAFTFASYCVNTPVLINNRSAVTGAASYQWSDGNGNTSSLVVPSFSYAQPGSYPLKLKISSSDCPLSPDSITQIINIEKPVAGIRMNTVSTQVLQPTNLQARGLGASYQWAPATDLSNATVAAPVLRPRTEQQLTVRITSAAGCVTVDTLLVKVFDNNIYVPNVFTPNGDGQNDVLYFNFVNISKLEYVRVFNRQGKRVFETTNTSEGWDGKFNGTLQPLESYVWMIKAIDSNGHPVTRQGTVTLLR